MRNDALQDAALRARAARDQHLFVDGRRAGNDVRLLLHARQQRLPVANAVALNAQQVDVRSRSEQAILQILTKAVVDRQRDNQRSYARRHSNDRDDRDHADHGLSAFGPQIARSYKKFKLHRENCSPQRHRGHRVIFVANLLRAFRVSVVIISLVVSADPQITADLIVANTALLAEPRNHRGVGCPMSRVFETWVFNNFAEAAGQCMPASTSSQVSNPARAGTSKFYGPNLGITAGTARRYARYGFPNRASNSRSSILIMSVPVMIANPASAKSAIRPVPTHQARISHRCPR